MQTLRWIAMLALASLGGAASAEPAVPDSLQPWVGWVLHEHPDIDCPRDPQSGTPTACAWISSLELQVTEAARFAMRVEVFADSRVRLPGDAAHRPSNVHVGTSKTTVLGDREPAILLGPGQHTVIGEIRWGQRPALLRIPTEIGLLKLTVDGQPVRRPTIRNQRVALTRTQTAAPATSANQLSLEVTRRVLDEYPMQLSTQIKLEVAGGTRTVEFGRALPQGFELLAFSSTIPARLNDNGELLAQVSAGTHRITFDARALEQPETLTFEPTSDLWPSQEVWGFVPRHNLRVVEVSAANPIDLNQVDWPYPESAQGYVLGPDEPMTLREKSRGIVEALPAQWSVQRNFWLGFDGDRWVVEDELRGTLRQPTRLAARYPLGRVNVDGTDELVNTVGDERPGIELGVGDFTVSAVSELQGSKDLHAVGWHADAQSLSATLQLPPGWRLLWAGGADAAPTSWLASWSLWDIFLGLLTVVLAYRFLGITGAALFGAAAFIALPAETAAVASWLIAFGLVVLARYVEGERFHRIARSMATTALLIAGLITLDVGVRSVQQAVYPQLEPPARAGTAFQANYDISADMAREVVMMESAPASVTGRAKPVEEIIVTASKRAPKYPSDLQVQTGPGKPDWRWHTHPLRWDGLVSGEAELNLQLASPLWVRLGNLLLAALSLGVIGVLIAQLSPNLRARLPSAFKGAAPALLLALVLTPDVHANYPSPQLLDALKSRLLEPPDCFPGCASVERATITLEGDELTILVEARAEATVSLPLPTSAAWQPDEATSNGQRATLRSKDQQLHAVLTPGDNRIALSGPVDHLDRFELSITSSLGDLSVRSSSNWIVSGLTRGRATRGSISFDRRAAETRDEARTLQTDPPRPFVEVVREIDFGLDWSVSTTVNRIAPAQGAFSITVPLISGEAVLDARSPVRNGQAEVVFGPRERTVSWQSRLPRETTQLVLTAGDVSALRERWQLNASNLWHVEPSGLPAIIEEDAQGMLFSPRSGEALTIAVQATTAVPGATLTVDRVAHRIEQGQRSQKHRLALELRATQGGSYPVQLRGAQNQLLEVRVNGERAPLNLIENRVDLPVTPGQSSYEITWQEDLPVGLVTTAELPQLASVANNLTSEVEVAASRWILLIGGPTLGPAMLIWGLAIVALIVALLLSRIPGFLIRPGDALLLAAGLTFANIAGALLMAAWFALLWIRPKLIERLEQRLAKNLVQLGIAAFSAIALLTLAASVPLALLSQPDMLIEGNGSWAQHLRWSLDHVPVDGGQSGWFFSVPIWVYRVTMLLWSLWLAFAVIRWVRDGWLSFKEPQLWYAKADSGPAAEPVDR